MKPLKQAQKGATMIEILIAILIFSVGLLGIASTQTMGLTNTQSALNRSIATQLAYDLVDIMRLNQGIVELGAFNNGGLFDQYATVSNTGAVNPREYSITNNCHVAAQGCTAIQMAQTELETWRQKVVRSLPDGQAQITLSNPAQGVFTILMTWQDIKAADAINANEGLTNVAGDTDNSIFRFQMDFRP